MSDTTGTHLVLGRKVAMPVQVRTATAFMAMYSVPTAPAQALIAGSGLEILQYRPGHGLCTLVFVDYVDGDLGPYNEFGVCFLVRDHNRRGGTVLQDLRELGSGGAGALIHRLPVDGDFTLAAGRGIWGFPKILADFDTDHHSATKRASVSVDDRLIAELTVARGIPVPGAGATASVAAYSFLDAVTRRTSWDMNPSGMRTRIGGATLRLGTHPIADELRSLGLPKRALVSSSIGNLAMTFGDAVEVPAR
ncbi:acetoacetate decarboxylase family protein [Rhodococcus sp. NPDC003382]|uniref:acetoacetate decarboxylase family protein n=1 Tax=unclassified Rhodococcus (in: high G+C Gram-positive bacteria) TaxID=192944 RepID=UPI0018CD2F69|nr:MULTISPECIES: acetoacetate decarboxylase family protein [unclassified Rhodococcus (in: high G+C Gram-positive bacteria)]MBH0119761.1 acetoacetate decarboxylase family protein [Rhodococcus sp. CX]MCK8672785.1 acetoacetate decarboxylase family protein [Rhodococcus sp. HM1]